MSAPQNASPCCSTQLTTQTPGPQGNPGTPGTNGINAYTTTQLSFVVPAKGGAVSVTVANNSWIASGQNIFIAGAGTFSVNSLSGTTVVGLTYLSIGGNTAAGNTINAGAQVSPAGTQPSFAGINTLTDSTGGTSGNTLAAGVGLKTLSLYVNLADLTAADLLTAYTPGYAFKILAITFAVEKAATTGSKAATLTPKINGAALTGGVLSLTSANCTPQGALVQASAVTGGNTGTNTSTISLTGSAVTAFVEGGGWILIQIQNLDTANAISSLANRVNAILGAS